MKFLSQREYDARLKEIQRKNNSIERHRKLREEERKMRPKRNHISTSKLYMALVIGISIEISIFIQYVTLKFGDTSCLYALAAIPVGSLAIPLVSYFRKSVAENCEGGIVYDMAMRNEMPERIANELDAVNMKDVEEVSVDDCIVEMEDATNGVG